MDRIAERGFASVSPSLPVQAQAQQSGPAQASKVVILFFAHDAVTLTPAMRAQVDDAIAAYRRSERVNLMIAGRIDGEPSSSASCGCVGYSQRRERLVRAYIVAAGVTDADIVAPVSTRTPLPDQAHIMITFGPGAGW